MVISHVVVSRYIRRPAASLRHLTKHPSPKLLYFLHLQDRDARNSFRFRSYENCRVSLAFSSRPLDAQTFRHSLLSGLVTSLPPYFFFPNSFSCNTYASPRKCCKQKTYGKAKPFRCNTYKKLGGTPPSGVSSPAPRQSCYLRFSADTKMLQLRAARTLIAFVEVPGGSESAGSGIGVGRVPGLPVDGLDGSHHFLGKRFLRLHKLFFTLSLHL